MTDQTRALHDSGVGNMLELGASAHPEEVQVAEGTMSKRRQIIDEHVYRLLAVAAALLLAIGTLAYQWLEDWGWVDSLYFSVVAVTTVGFGDLTPSSDGSKLFTVAYILSGITIVTTYLNQRFKYRTAARMKQRAAQVEEDVDDDAG